VDKLVLVIDRDTRERGQIAAILREADFQVVDVASTVRGMVHLIEEEPALIVMAEETEPLRLHEIVHFVRGLTGAPVMIIGSGGMTEEEELLMRGGDFYLGRPFTAAELAIRARMLVRRGEDPREKPETRLSLEQPPDELSSTAKNVRPIGMRLLRWDDERVTTEATAAS
jgi:DNA-binding response OmpR family regulator